MSCLETSLAISPRIDLDRLNACLEGVEAPRVVRWAADTFGDGLVMSTSFGIQSAALLHMATRVVPRLPVLWIDTGYLPPETYRFAEELTRRLNLDLRVYQSPVSPARMEATLGRLWEGDAPSLDHYHQLRKVEPMHRALRELGATAWLSGLRADQTQFRAGLPIVGRQGERFKVSPLLRWHARDVHAYLKRHGLPYHPFFELGYASVGDWHSSRPLAAGDSHERDTRFRGLRQECGIHLTPREAESLDSSGL